MTAFAARNPTFSDTELASHYRREAARCVRAAAVASSESMRKRLESEAKHWRKRAGEVETQGEGR